MVLVVFGVGVDCFGVGVGVGVGVAQMIGRESFGSSATV
jgi:hypothetical protein